MSDGFANSMSDGAMIGSGTRGDALSQLFPDSQSAKPAMTLDRFLTISIPNTASLNDLEQYVHLGTTFITDFLVNNPNEFFLTDIAPIKVSNAITVAWDEVYMTMDVADPIEEFESPNIVGHSIKSFVDHTKRYMKAFKISSDTLHTERGRMFLVLKYQQLAAAMSNSMALGAYLNMLECHEWDEAIRMYLGKQYGDMTIEAVLEHQKHQFASLAMGDKEQVLYKNVEIAFQENEGVVDTMILPAKSKITMEYRDNSESNKNRYDKDGEVGVRRQFGDALAVGTVDGGKIRVYESGTWPHESQDIVREPGNIPTVVGERADMQNITHENGNIKMFNYTKDEPQLVRMTDALRVCGVWDEQDGCFSRAVYRAIHAANEYEDRRQMLQKPFPLASMSSSPDVGFVPATHVGKVMSGHMGPLFERVNRKAMEITDGSSITNVNIINQVVRSAYMGTAVDLGASLLRQFTADGTGLALVNTGLPGFANTARFTLLGGDYASAVGLLNQLVGNLRQLFFQSKIFEGKYSDDTDADVILRDFFWPVNPIMIGHTIRDDANAIGAGRPITIENMMQTLKGDIANGVGGGTPEIIISPVQSEEVLRFANMLLALEIQSSEPSKSSWNFTTEQARRAFERMTPAETDAFVKFSTNFTPIAVGNFDSPDDLKISLFQRNLIPINIIKDLFAEKVANPESEVLVTLANAKPLLSLYKKKTEKVANPTTFSIDNVLEVVTINRNLGDDRDGRTRVTRVKGIYLTEAVLDKLFELKDGNLGVNVAIMDPDTGGWIMVSELTKEIVARLKKYLLSRTSNLGSLATGFSCVRKFLHAQHRDAVAKQQQQAHGTHTGSLGGNLPSREDTVVMDQRFQLHRMSGDYYNDLTGPAMIRNLTDLATQYPVGTFGFILGAFYLFMPIDTMESVQYLYSRGLPLPFRLMLVRNRMTFRMKTVIFCIRGRQTAETYYGYAGSATNHDESTRIIRGSFSARFKTIVKARRHVLPGMKLLPGGYLGGGNCEFIMPENYRHELSSPIHPDSPSILAMIVGIDEGPSKLKDTISLTGHWHTDPYFRRLKNGAPNANDLHYSSALMYNELYEFSKVFTNAKKLQARSSRDTADLIRATSLVSQCLQCRMNVATGRMDEFITSKSELKNRGSIPGARDTWNARASEFPPLDWKQQQILWGTMY